ncbi:polysaccharide deacetylase family protein [Planococcus shenhongbingii]|uniref:Polysaccharide deacetylase family protein n=1 Tax=Planococcus shenhongbingii TaxID=3058398 RepID=A0ABT8NBN2_9BACL|nr:polysaccharide deacetylase family protein [Planococcus sp. N017]MDN7245294.1 polysaccharide deacetylase family protein [Planococcus sp. N017]
MYGSSNPDIVTVNPKAGEKSVVLTFDDGPSRALPQILDVLKLENVPAAFFWQTRLLYSARPWKRVLEEGHQIGSHTTKHLNLVNLSFEEQYQDIKNSIAKIEQVTGSDVKYFRPPFGQFNEDTLQAAKALDVKTVMWRVASMDWELKKSPQQIVCTVRDNLEDGAVILLHELQHTADILPDLIKAIREKGYSFSGLPAE